MQPAQSEYKADNAYSYPGSHHLSSGFKKTACKADIYRPSDVFRQMPSYSTGHAPVDGASGAQHGAPVSFIIACSAFFWSFSTALMS